MSNNEKSIVGPIKEQQLIELYVKTAADIIKERWNTTSDIPIDIRFTLNKAKLAKPQNGVKGQVSLALELKYDLTWSLVTRKVANARKVADLEDVHLTLALWRDMFVEITQLGFIGAINLSQNIHTKEHDQFKNDTIKESRPDQEVNLKNSRKS